MNIGTNCHLSCHKGYGLHGAGRIKCDNNGTWVTSEESHCRSKLQYNYFDSIRYLEFHILFLQLMSEDTCTI